MNRKTTLWGWIAFLVIFESLAAIQTSHSQAHIWSRAFGGTEYDQGYAVAVDGSGNVAVLGVFSDSINFGGATLVETGTGSYGLFLAKFSGNDGSHLWSRRLGVVGPQRTGDPEYALAVDSRGNLLASGTFDGTLDFGSPPTSGAAGDVFVAKFTGDSGFPLWSRRFETVVRSEASGVAVDSDGNVLVTGFSESGFFFLRKLSGTNGSDLWGKGFNASNLFPSVAVDSSNNVMLTGWFRGTVDFGGGPLTSAGGWDAYLAKFNGNAGSHLWSKRFGGTGDDYGDAVAADSSDNIVLTGQFSGSVDFGGGPLTSGPRFVAKFTAAGSHLWSRVSNNAPFGSPVVVDGSDDIFLVGSSVRKLSGADGSDLFPTPVGFGGSDAAVDSGGNIVLTGRFSGTRDFGGGPLTSAGNFDIFVVKLSGTPPPPAVSDGGTVNNGSFAPHPAPLAPGSIAAIFGSHLNNGTAALSSGFGPDDRLVTTLEGASVTVNDIPAPLFYSTPDQLGVQIPFELAGETSATVRVTVGGETSVPRTIFLAPVAPGIFTQSQDGRGAAAALHQDNRTPITDGLPTQLEEVIVLFATGLGSVSPPLASGARSVGNFTVSRPTVTIDGIAADVLFSGAAPHFVGLYQINVRIPPNARPGPDVPLVLDIGGVLSNTVTIAVQ